MDISERIDKVKALRRYKIEQSLVVRELERLIFEYKRHIPFMLFDGTPRDEIERKKTQLQASLEYEKGKIDEYQEMIDKITPYIPALNFLPIDIVNACKNKFTGMDINTRYEIFEGDNQREGFITFDPEEQIVNGLNPSPFLPVMPNLELIRFEQFIYFTRARNEYLEIIETSEVFYFAYLKRNNTLYENKSFRQRSVEVKEG